VLWNRPFDHCLSKLLPALWPFQMSNAGALGAARTDLARAIASGQDAAQLKSDLSTAAAWVGLDLQRAVGSSTDTAKATPEVETKLKVETPVWAVAAAKAVVQAKSALRVAVLDRDPAGMSSLSLPVWAQGQKAVATYGPLLINNAKTLSVTDLELFGFWTMEFRLGHKLWSTAHARYGRALRASGVQVPPPPLSVNADRQPVPPPPAAAELSIVAVADLAQTVNNGVSLTLRTHPQTGIWYLLYAQVQRVDGQAWRNILLATTLGRQIPRGKDELYLLPAQSLTIPAYGIFPQKQVENLLKQLQLPTNTPVSVLAVELFHGEATVVPPIGDVPGAVEEPMAAVVQSDPLGVELGARRVLRVSPLTAVRPIC
jgi:hypothetical protein